MPHIRLVGLVLFITSFFLALAAAATQTSHIRLKTSTREAVNELANPPSDSRLSPSGASGSTTQPVDQLGEATSTGEPQFISIPVIYPLMVAAICGLLLWFVPAPLSSNSSRRKKRRR